MKAAMHVESLERYLVWFMRLMAVVFFTLGLYNCGLILDVAGNNYFLHLSLLQQTLIGFFAVANIVAAIGLWLTSSWGAVVWLFVAVADMIIHAFFHKFALTPLPLLIFHAASMGVYLWLSIQIARQRSF